MVQELLDLKYEDKYLLFIISLRAILEDLVKTYIANKHSLSLASTLKDNVINTIDDLQKTIDITKGDSKKIEKQEIHKRFKGRDALKNFLSGLKVKFEDEEYDKFFHSLTHNPTKINESLALEISNDMILPLYVLIKDLKDHSIN